MPDLIRLVIVEESAYLRRGLKAEIEVGGGLEVVGDISPGEGAVELVERIGPDVVLMSIRWPDVDAVAICREIRERVPTTRVVMLSHQDCEEEVLLSILAGASGCVSEDAQKPELLQAISTADSGGGYFDWEAVRRVVARLQNSDSEQPANGVAGVLSEREVTILRMIAEGCTNRQISQKLNIAAKTARSHAMR